MISQTNTQKIYTIDELKEKLTPVFASAPIYKAILFGSYVRGEADEKSDIDIVIDTKRQLTGFDFYGVVADIEDAVEKNIDLIEINHIKKDAPILNTIKQEGVTLYERF